MTQSQNRKATRMVNMRDWKTILGGALLTPFTDDVELTRGDRETYTGQAKGNLLAASQVYITIVYHADRRTYHPLPNAGEYQTQGSNCRSSFGEDAFRHLLILQKW